MRTNGGIKDRLENSAGLVKYLILHDMEHAKGMSVLILPG